MDASETLDAAFHAAVVSANTLRLRHGEVITDDTAFGNYLGLAWATLNLSISDNQVKQNLLSYEKGRLFQLSLLLSHEFKYKPHDVNTIIQSLATETSLPSQLASAPSLETSSETQAASTEDSGNTYANRCKKNILRLKSKITALPDSAQQRNALQHVDRVLAERENSDRTKGPNGHFSTLGSTKYGDAVYNYAASREDSVDFDAMLKTYKVAKPRRRGTLASKHAATKKSKTVGGQSEGKKAETASDQSD